MGAKALDSEYFQSTPLEVVSVNNDISEIESVRSEVLIQAPWFWGIKEHEAPLITFHKPVDRLRNILYIIKAIPQPLVNEEIAEWQNTRATSGRLENAGLNAQKQKIQTKPPVNALQAYRQPEVKLEVLSALSYKGDLVVATIDTLEKWRQDQSDITTSERNSALAHTAFELTLFGVNSNNFMGLVRESYKKNK